MNMFLAVIIGALAVLATACGVTREDALEELTSVGYSPESAECIMTSIEGQGFEAGDLADPVEPEVETAIEVGVEECITTEDLSGLGAEIGEDELRNQVREQLVATGLDETQAQCVIDSVEGEGFSMIDVAEAGLEGQTEGGVIDVMATATLSCLTGG